jgi:hypothetical protein
MPFIEKCTELTKNQEELAKLLSDVLPLQLNTIYSLLNLPCEDISPYLYPHMLPNEHKERRGT